MGFRFTKLALALTLIVALMSSMVGFSMAVSDKDREECAEQLVGLATCLPYVGGNAKSPTPDCCNGLKHVLKDKKKCLCVIIVDRNDPDLGLKINATLALGLPSVCHASANVSQCPGLLHLAPNSPDAQVFYEFGNRSNQSSSTPVPAPTPDERGNSRGQIAQTRSRGCSISKRWIGFGFEMVSLGFSLWYFLYPHLFT
ncbi:non-specific lipid transfer protein GPI-anchored 14 isoform X2 [Manihot esculenta]|uniref:non-specific lipid transfer protein GPI-anchored 14 isoform X2 n=1 Tax=Manihot esculenta TaxID=3983 RepID=UPI000B5D1B1F|nr:non-specific lipid transfer protein GPI-anchored 14 isoform X2 [Manihot esculenta]